MRIAVCCGGTGGHVFPGLAVADELKKHGHDVVLWLAGRGVEESAASSWTGPVIRVRAQGLAGFRIRSVVAAWSMLRAVLDCRKEMKAVRPSVLLAMGSYSSVGPVLAAWSLGIPVVLHEANAIPGRAISMLSRFARVVAVSYEAARSHMRSGKCVYTGFPVRERIRMAGRGKGGGGVFNLMVTGGSQGAHALNEVVSQAVCDVHGSGMPISVTHLTGARDEAFVRARYEEAGVTHTVHAFLAEMEKAYISADLVICRSGAATCAEIETIGVPALLVPLPGAPRDHQTLNAVAALDIGVADMVSQDRFTREWLAAYLLETGSNRQKLDGMRKAAMARPALNAVANLAGLVERTGEASACRQ